MPTVLSPTTVPAPKSLSLWSSSAVVHGQAVLTCRHYLTLDKPNNALLFDVNLYLSGSTSADHIVGLCFYFKQANDQFDLEDEPKVADVTANDIAKVFRLMKRFLNWWHGRLPLKGNLLRLNNNSLDKPITISSYGPTETANPSAVKYPPSIIVGSLDHLGVSGIVNVDENTDGNLLSFASLVYGEAVRVKDLVVLSTSNARPETENIGLHLQLEP
ncbi:hypothetical protein BT96DRAFT_935663 [Gymnopus androsaceus JB14]|uniref:Uncharacterized protein n=1 Tax=Gymnopus androsaceus JB14 TaxID=1447944 RepID=A0A6A4I524_9AGAR|nr:hypothetical protein BT96DRAFT_935663 [Gymnopus androsaceus JB14]